MQPIETAIAHIRAGKMVIVVDDENRENEGDLIAAASLITEETITFMARQGCGLICLAMSQEQIEKLQLPLMVAETKNQEQQKTAFTISIDAATGVTTGISARDRAKTILAACHPMAKSEDIVSPGHVFPLRAKQNGVLTRRGHTEAAVDLMRLAGLPAAGVICEIMAEDGTMMRLPQLKEFAKQWQLPWITIEQLVAYRQSYENDTLQLMADCMLPTDYGEFVMRVYQNTITKEEAVVLLKGDNFSQACVRIHSSCFTGDIFSSLRCDCGEQLDKALSQLANSTAGILIYLSQEGRGIGLTNKIRSYALQESGLDTIEANHALGFSADLRRYDMAVAILQQLQVMSMKVLTNNPEKITALQQHWPKAAIQRIPLLVAVNDNNRHYLATKKDKMKHLLGEYDYV